LQKLDPDTVLLLVQYFIRWPGYFRHTVPSAFAEKGDPKEKGGILPLKGKKIYLGRLALEALA